MSNNILKDISDFEVTPLSYNEAESFVKKVVSPQETVSKKSVFIGILKDSKVVTVFEFKKPSKKYSSKYSSEMSLFISKKECISADFIEAAIKKYIKNHSPADFFIALKIGEPLKDILIKSGMRLVKEDKSNTVLEWVDEKRTYYTYKITSTKSEKYYIGVSHVKNRDASIEDCINDGYWGSGGVKYKNWLKKYELTVKKEIYRLFKYKSEAYNHEKDLLGDLWFSDKNCLNSKPGGYGDVIHKNISVSIKECLIHGKVKHRGDRCYTCVNQSAVYKDICEIHGETKFRAKICVKCSLPNNQSLKECSEHGVTNFLKDNCRKCAVAKTLSTQICEIHGKARFVKNKCRKCISDKSFYDDLCDKHGKTKFKANKCLKCKAEEHSSFIDCDKHGETIHYGGVCRKCISESSKSLLICEKHGETSFTGNTCRKCVSESIFSQKECEVHGLVTFRGEKCTNCSNQKAVSVKECSTHGETKFQGNTCVKCAMLKRSNRKTSQYLFELKDAKKYWSKENAENIKEISIKSTKRFVWNCTNDLPHTFIKSASSFASNRRCLVCSSLQLLKGFNDLLTTHPKLATEWSDKNKLKVTEITKKTSSEFLWVDSLGHEWSAKISTRLKGKGCPYCASQKVLRGFNDIFSTHPELERFWNFEKNQKIKPTEITKGSNKSVWWICKLGHEEFLSPKMFLRNLCRECKSINNPKYGKTLKTLSKKS